MKKLHILIPSLACAGAVPVTLGVVSCSNNDAILVHVDQYDISGLKSAAFDGKKNQKYTFVSYMSDWRNLVDPYFTELAPSSFYLSINADPLTGNIPMIVESIVFKVDWQTLICGSEGVGDYYYYVDTFNSMYRINLNESGWNKVKNGQRITISVKFEREFVDCAFFAVTYI